jgi:hypothetical protein
MELDRSMIEHLISLLTPVTFMGDSDEFENLLDLVGWDASTLGVSATSLASGAASLATALDSASQVADQGDIDLATVAETLVSLGMACAGFAQSLSGMPVGSGVPANALAELGSDLLGFLLESHTAGSFPRTLLAATLLGFVKHVSAPQVVSGDGTVLRPAMTGLELDFGALDAALRDPLGYARATFLLDSAGARRAADAIADLAGPVVADGLVAAGITAGYGITPAEPGLSLTAAEQAAAAHLLLVDFLNSSGGTTGILRIALGLTDDTNQQGLGILIAASGDISISRTLANGTLTLTFSGAQQPLLITSKSIGFASGSGGPVSFDVGVKYATSGSPAARFGSPAGTRLEVGKLAADIGFSADGSGVDVKGSIDLGGVLLAINGADGDGFMSTVLPPSPIESSGDLGLDVGLREGIQVRGAGGLEWRAGVGQSIGPLELTAIEGALKFSSGAASLQLAVTLGVTLGPLSGTVDAIGIAAELHPASSTSGGPAAGNLGPYQLDAAFKPPDGAGLAVDATVITGGGYIECHPDVHEYDGILQLQLEGIGIGAIGLLNTVLPDGSKGFSLLLILYAQFEDAPVQLGFGFELTGLGGLVGINRTLVEEVLANGVRNGAVRSILFPDDPVKNGPKIISDLRSIFPPQRGHYVFGPMVELAWGVPPLITAELGVILELPAPIRIVILGRISTALPDPDAALIEINLDAAGGLDFGQKSAWATAHLYDSRIVQYALSGDMVFLWDWGDQPNFVLAVGGFDPRYQPPPGLAPVDRVTLTIGAGDNPRFTLDGYVAVTSNSLQHGAQVSVYAADAGFAVQGSLGYDILVILNPLSFIADMQASVEFLHGSTTLMTAQLQLTLSGPTPWHAHGSASVHILFIHPSVNIDKQWGDPTQQSLPSTNAEKPFLAALGNPSNWIASPPPGAEVPVSLGGIPADTGTVLVHPLGQVSVRQKIVPLELTITRFGSSSVDGPSYFRIAAITVNGHAAPDITPAHDEFAMGQFVDLSDDQKLSSPSFEQQKSGATLGSATMTIGHRSSLGVQYETFVVDRQGASSHQGTYQLGAASMAAARRWGAGAIAPVLTSGRSKYLAPGTTSPIVVGQLQHVIADVSTLVPRLDIASAGTLTGTRQALSSHLAQHPEDKGLLQVVPVYEAAA